MKKKRILGLGALAVTGLAVIPVLALTSCGDKKGGNQKYKEKHSEYVEFLKREENFTLIDNKDDFYGNDDFQQLLSTIDDSSLPNSLSNKWQEIVKVVRYGTSYNVDNVVVRFKRTTNAIPHSSKKWVPIGTEVMKHEKPEYSNPNRVGVEYGVNYNLVENKAGNYHFYIMKDIELTKMNRESFNSIITKVRETVKNGSDFELRINGYKLEDIVGSDTHSQQLAQEFLYIFKNRLIHTSPYLPVEAMEFHKNFMRQVERKALINVYEHIMRSIGIKSGGKASDSFYQHLMEQRTSFTDITRFVMSDKYKTKYNDHIPEWVFESLYEGYELEK